MQVQKNDNAIPIHIYIVLLSVLWSLLIVAMAVWKINHNSKTTYELAESQARANFNKDKAFRLWMTGHGRVYIPVGENYQPDPYLAHIKDRDVTTPYLLATAVHLQDRTKPRMNSSSALGTAWTSATT